MKSTFAILGEVAEERVRQDAKWGQQDHPDWTPTPNTSCFDLVSTCTAKQVCDSKARAFEGTCLGYTDILVEEVAEARDEERAGNVAALREELIQTAAVAVAWVESIDRRLAVDRAPPLSKLCSEK